MPRKIEVVDYNPAWEKEYKEEAKKIKKILGKNCVSINHIGSTSVRGMKAKPIIDIMAVVKNLSLVDEHNQEFIDLSYECKGEYGIPGRRFFMKGGDNRTHHIHIFEEKNNKDAARHLAVREYLKTHPETAKEYSELKVRLAEEFPYDNDGYCDGKAEYMKQLEETAMEWTEEQMQLGGGMSMGMCLGMAIGMLIGSMYSQMVLGMCLGMAAGSGLGAVYGHAKNKKN